MEPIRIGGSDGLQMLNVLAFQDLKAKSFVLSAIWHWNCWMLCRLGTLVFENVKGSKHFGIRQPKHVYCLQFDAGNGECFADWGPWWLTIVNVLRISGPASKISCTVGHLTLEMVNVLQIGDPGG